MSSQYSCGLEVTYYRWICKWQSIDVFILCRSLCISMPSYVFYIKICLALCQTNHSILFCLLCMDSFAHSTRQRKCIWRIWVDYEVFFVLTETEITIPNKPCLKTMWKCYCLLFKYFIIYCDFSLVKHPIKIIFNYAEK